MADKTLVCKDCGAEFVFTEGEQAFMLKKDSITNHKDVQLAEKQEKKQEEINNKMQKDTFSSVFFVILFVNQ